MQDNLHLPSADTAERDETPIDLVAVYAVFINAYLRLIPPEEDGEA